MMYYTIRHGGKISIGTIALVDGEYVASFHVGPSEDAPVLIQLTAADCLELARRLRVEANEIISHAAHAHDGGRPDYVGEVD